MKKLRNESDLTNEIDEICNDNCSVLNQQDDKSKNEKQNIKMSSLLNLFTNKQVKSVLFIVCLLNILQQISGIFNVIYKVLFVF